MQIVILAAGKGTRLSGQFGEIPKSLLPVGHGASYLDLTVKSLRQFDFTRKIVVTGYQSSQLETHFAARDDTDFEFVHNPDFEKGNLFTLLAAKSRLTEGFYLYNADHFYSPRIFQKIFSEPPQTLTLFCDLDRSLSADDMKVHLEKKSGATFLSMSKTLTQFEWGYVGVTFVPRDFQARYWQACDKVVEERGDPSHVEHVMAHLGSEGVPVNICDISGSWWTEIDTIEDYESACAVLAKHGSEITAWMEP